MNSSGTISTFIFISNWAGMDKIARFTQTYLKKTIPDFRSGDTVKVYQKIKEGDKERVQAFEGLVIARKHGVTAGASFTVRKVTAGVGVEKTYPLHAPWIEKLEVLKRTKARRSKLYFVREAKGKRARMKGVRAEAPVAVTEQKETEVVEANA